MNHISCVRPRSTRVRCTCNPGKCVRVSRTATCTLFVFDETTKYTLNVWVVGAVSLPSDFILIFTNNLFRFWRISRPFNYFFAFCHFNNSKVKNILLLNKPSYKWCKCAFMIPPFGTWSIIFHLNLDSNAANLVRSHPKFICLVNELKRSVYFVQKCDNHNSRHFSWRIRLKVFGKKIFGSKLLCILQNDSFNRLG